MKICNFRQSLKRKVDGIWWNHLMLCHKILQTNLTKCKIFLDSANVVKILLLVLHQHQCHCLNQWWCLHKWWCLLKFFSQCNSHKWLVQYHRSWLLLQCKINQSRWSLQLNLKWLQFLHQPLQRLPCLPNKTWSQLKPKQQQQLSSHLFFNRPHNFFKIHLNRFLNRSSWQFHNNNHSCNSSSSSSPNCSNNSNNQTWLQLRLNQLFKLSLSRRRISQIKKRRND